MKVLELWLRSPLLRVALPVLAGIYGAEMRWLWLFCAAFLFCYLCFFFIGKGVNRHWESARFSFHTGIFYSVLWVVAGVFLSNVQGSRLDRWHAIHRGEANGVYAFQVVDEPVLSGGRFKVVVEVQSVFDNGVFTPCRGRASLVLECDSMSSIELHADQCVLGRMALKPPTGARNPMEFDYWKYLRYQGIELQGYVGADEWRIDSANRQLTLRGTFVRWREWLLEKLASQPIEPREVGVLSALVLGKAVAIDREVMQVYAKAGVVHVLAVSGMHVALIYLILKPLFQWVFGKRKARALRTLLPVLLLWIYAAMTGFSPSVLRAAWMFSFVIVADNYGLRNTIYNTMGASALVLMVVDPHVPHSMGFMLSYLAVAGIAVIHPLLHRKLYFSSRIARWLWELTSISISAQLATLPLTLFLFHQFPTWFIVTNALVIPLSTVVLYVALLFFACMAFAPIATFLGGLVGLLTRIMNDLMEWSSQWPYALIDHVYWEAWEAIVCVLLVVSACRTLLLRSKRSLLWSMGLVFVWLVFAALRHTRVSQRMEVCLHSAYKGECLTAHAAGQLISLSTEGVSESPMRNYTLHWQAEMSVQQRWQQEFSNGHALIRPPWIQLGDCRILIADSTLLRRSLGDSSVAILISDWDKPRYWSEAELACLSGHTVFLGNKLSRKRRAWLLEHLQDSCSIFDLSEGAVLWSEGRWLSYREKYE